MRVEAARIGVVPGHDGKGTRGKCYSKNNFDVISRFNILMCSHGILCN